jgi:hypothetical protein
MVGEREVKKLLTPGCRVTNEELHLIVVHCPAHRVQAWDQLLGQPQSHRDLRWILHEAPNAERYKQAAKEELSKMEIFVGRRAV